MSTWNKDIAVTIFTMLGERQGFEDLPTLIRDVAEWVGVETHYVTPVLWELVDEGRLSYGADAKVRFS